MDFWAIQWVFSWQKPALMMIPTRGTLSKFPLHYLPKKRVSTSITGPNIISQDGNQAGPLELYNPMQLYPLTTGPFKHDAPRYRWQTAHLWKTIPPLLPVKRDDSHVPVAPLLQWLHREVASWHRKTWQNVLIRRSMALKERSKDRGLHRSPFQKWPVNINGLLNGGWS